MYLAAFQSRRNDRVSEGAWLSRVEDWLQLLEKALVVGLEDFSLGDHLHGLDGVEVAGLHEVVLEVGPPQVRHLEVTNCHAITAEELSLVLLKLGAHLVANPLDSSEVLLRRLLISLLLNSRWADKVPLLVEEIKGSVDFPGSLSFDGVESEFFGEGSGESVSFIHHHIALLPARKTASGVLLFERCPLLKRDSLVDVVDSALGKHESEELSTAVAIEIGEGTLWLAANNLSDLLSWLIFLRIVTTHF